MRQLALIAPLVIAFASAALTASQEREDVPGPSFSVVRTWASCAECHAAPDARVEHDGRWIGLNETTACLTGEAAEPENRRALIAFLEAGRAPLPELVRSRHRAESADPVPGCGAVELPSTSGSALLRRGEGDDVGKDVRIYWEASKDGRIVDLPVGDYTLIGYSFYRVDRKGRRWTASATVQEGEDPDVLEVRGEEPVRLSVVPRMFSDLKAEVDGDILEVTFQKRNEAGDRMTLTCDGDLVEPTWVLEANDAGAPEVTGPMAPT